MSAVEPRTAPALARTVRKGCAQLFVIFAARRDDEATFTDAGDFLANSKLGGRNLILVRDPFERNYALGVGSPLGSATLLARWLKDRRDEMTHVREVYTLGHSSGGFGALLFGHLLEVDRAFAFSPRAARIAGADIAKSELVERLSQPNGKTSYEVCFSPLNEADLAFAERLRRCPGVTLAPRSEFGDVHGVMAELLDRGELAAMLPPFVKAEAS